MPHDMDDTICALATPPGIASIGVVRLSGPRAFAITDAITTRPGNASCATHKGHTLRHATVVNADGTPIDHVLLAIFHAPRSYTGENVIELHAHGGPVPLRQILERLLTSGARLARPGEFTQRAYLNGKLDLSQAEAVADIIAARTDEAHALAQKQLHGDLRRAVTDLRTQIITVLARLEATIDFPEDVPDLDPADCAHDIQHTLTGIARLLSTAANGILTREGATLVLIGRPNVGKSSLLNALLRTARAIVTPIPGTTRDTLEETLNLRGIPLRAIDTAGLRDTADPLEQHGIARARAASDSADFLLLITDATHIGPEDDALLAQIKHRPHLVVRNKWDLMPPDATPPAAIPVSAATGWNLSALEDAIHNALTRDPVPTDTPTVTHARHKHALVAASDSLKAALITLERGLPLDFLSIDLHAALIALGAVTGETTPDDIITEIFSRFCIGK